MLVNFTHIKKYEILFVNFKITDIKYHQIRKEIMKIAAFS